MKRVGQPELEVEKICISQRSPGSEGTSTRTTLKLEVRQRLHWFQTSEVLLDTYNQNIHFKYINALQSGWTTEAGLPDVASLSKRETNTANTANTADMVNTADKANTK